MPISPPGEQSGRTKDTTRLFHGPWHDRVGEHICAQPFRMWNRLRFYPFLQVSQIFQRRKSDANKQDFENKFNLTCHAQSTHKTIGILIKVFCTSGPNLVVPAWKGDELSHGQAQNGVNFDFEGKFDLWRQKSITPQNNRDLNQCLLHPCFKFGDPSLKRSRVIARTSKWLTHRLTHRRRQRQYPKAKTGLG